jgi:hypothetical protein
MEMNFNPNYGEHDTFREQIVCFFCFSFWEICWRNKVCLLVWIVVGNGTPEN